MTAAAPRCCGRIHRHVAESWRRPSSMRGSFATSVATFCLAIGAASSLALPFAPVIGRETSLKGVGGGAGLLKRIDGGTINACQGTRNSPGGAQTRETTLRMKGGDGIQDKIPMGVAYGLGFGAITAGRICQEAHLQGFFMRVLGMPPAMVAAGWTSLCIIIAFAEPLIGVTIDNLRNKGMNITSLLRVIMIPWAILLYLVWRPSANPSPLLFFPVIVLSLLQASLNLGFLSIYPTLFPTPEARSKALAPQQAMVVGGLLLGMILPTILSQDWTNPLAFSLKFSVFLALFLTTSVSLLSSWEARPLSPPKGGLKAAAAPLKTRVPPGGIIQGLKEIAGNARLRRVMASIFLGQIGNALLASSLPIFCREVVELSEPIGPFLGGLVPSLSAAWQFSVCFALFYFLGGATAGWWSRLAAERGTVGALRLSMRTYALGCIALAVGPGGLISSLKPWINASPTNKFLLLLACYALNGLSLGGLVSLPDVALAEGVNELEASGQGGGKAGKVYGAKQLVYRMGSAVQGVITASVLYSVQGSWKAGLPFLAGLLPALFYGLASTVLPKNKM